MNARVYRPLLVLLALVAGVTTPALAQGGNSLAYVTNRNANSVSVVDTTTNTVIDTVPVGVNPQFIVFTPDGDQAWVVNANSGSVSVIDLATHTVDATIPVGTLPHAIDFTPDGVFAYVTVSNLDKVVVVNTTTYAIVATIPVIYRPGGVAITPDGATAYVANEHANQISLIDTATQATVGGTIAVGSRPAWLAIEPDGSHVYIPLLGSNAVTIVDTATNTVTGNVTVGNDPIAVVFRPDGAFAYASNNSSNTVSVIDTSSQSVVATVSVGTQPVRPGVSPDGAFLYVPNFINNSVSIIDTATNSVSAVFPVGTGPWGVAIARAHSAPEFDQDVTNEVIFGSGNVNGGFTTDRTSGVELGMRGKVLFPVPMNVFNSNGDGTYVFPVGAHLPESPQTPLWSIEWSANTDFDGSSGHNLADLTYELGLDFDPGSGTNYLAFDTITPGSTIPWVPPVVAPFFDNAIGDNTTPNGGGTVAGDATTYAALIAANNLAQNLGRMDFVDNPPFSFDPTVPGQYEYYLAAFDGVEQVARTSITIFALDGSTLLLEAPTCQADMDLVKPGIQVEVELTMRNLISDVTGYQAFLAYDTGSMTYEPTSSSYTATPFTANITPITAAEVFPGELWLDGNTFFPDPPTDEDALLATLVFTVAAECTPTLPVTFDLTQAFDSELSFLGSPLVTDLIDSPAIVPDVTPPVITPGPDITVSADADVGNGCVSAIVNYTPPAVSDSCTGVTLVCTPPPGTAFPAGTTTTVTCTATDECGNVSIESFDVTVTLTNKVYLDVQLVGVSSSPTRCIHFMLDCGSAVDIPLAFDGTGHFIGEIEVPCGSFEDLCAKDEQHTKYGNIGLDIVGAKYVGDAVLQLNAGDTDNDGDVDINDVTLFIGQFGLFPVPLGGCPWDTVTRDADFSDNGAVGLEDYSFLTANWLTFSGCVCAANTSGGGRSSLATRAQVNSKNARSDLDKDGWIDWRDVMVLEHRHGFSGELSRRMRATER